MATYYPQTSGQVERYNRNILFMLRNYVNERRNDWDRYTTALMYAYNCHVHRSTDKIPLNLVLSRPPLEFSPAPLSYVHLREPNRKKNTRDDWTTRFKRLTRH